MKAKILLIILIALQLLTIASALTISNVETTPSEVAPGAEIVLSIGVENNLDDDAEDVEVSLILIPFVINSNSLNPVLSEKIPLASETSAVYFEEIKEGREKNAIFNLVAEADADAGIYKIPVVLSYSIKGEEITKMFSIFVTINSKPNFLLDVDGFLLKNNNNELVISITNTGLSKAKFLEVELGDGGLYNILSQKHIYVGDLDSDDFDTINFDIYVKDIGNLAIPIILTYRDAINKEYTESKIVQMKVYSEKEAIDLGLIKKSNTIIYLVIVIFLIGV